MRTTSSTKYDAIIVGAGPAGSTAAILLARAGWSVALVERQTFPRRKVCGECIAASNLPLLQALGILEEIDACAGPPLQRVTLLHGDHAVTADLPAAADPRYRWGRALGRETLDALLLERARGAGATVLQPQTVQAILGTAGAWSCELRSAESNSMLRLSALVVIDAHGAWEDLPSARERRRPAHDAADLFAFKANFTDVSLDDGAISVLALDGGYGGMVVADGGLATVACCLRRDRLSGLRSAAPGIRAGDSVEAWLRSECSGVALALKSASRVGPWLAAGPIAPGMRVGADDEHFRIGNAAGEAHPILGEGISMALQSAALLCSHLLKASPAALSSRAADHAELHRSYSRDWARHFRPRLRLAAVFAHGAMHPRSAAWLVRMARAWPGLLTNGARWGGKVQSSAHDTSAPQGMASPVSPAPAHLAADFGTPGRKERHERHL